MNIKSKIGLRIRQIRLEQNVTQEAVAFKAEIDRTFMNHVENGRRNVSIEILEKIIVLGLGKSLKYFFGDQMFNEIGGYNE